MESFVSKASSRRSSHGTVSTSSTACLVDSDTRTMPGRRVVTAMWLGNLSCRSRSTSSCQSLAEVRMPADVLPAGVACSPALTKAMDFLEGRNCFAHTSPVLMASAMVLRTWSCLHRYRPSPSALVQQLRMCSRVPHLEHNGHAGVSAIPHVCRFDGLGSLNEELNVVRLSFRELSPRDFPLNRALPSCPSSLLPHSHCPARS